MARPVPTAPWRIAFVGIALPMVGGGFTGWPFALGWLVALAVAWAIGRHDPGTRRERIATALVLLPLLLLLGWEGGWWLIPADLAWLASEL